MALRFRSDLDKHVLISNFTKRGWTRSLDDTDWNFFWASPHSVKAIFSTDSHTRLHDHQLISHFPNHCELTRKDLMVKNLKRYRKELERLHTERGLDSSPDFDVIPTTFLLPADLSLFVEEYKRNPSSVWIMKPTSKSQGKGIFLISRLAQVKRWANSRGATQQLKDGAPHVFRAARLVIVIPACSASNLQFEMSPAANGHIATELCRVLAGRSLCDLEVH
jgi:tubulin polyglutamylase TTLL1